MKFVPHKYQVNSINHIINNPKCGLFLDMGLGKTVTTLTAISDLKYNRFEVNKVLVIAPLKVAQTTWSDEIHKWEQLSHLKISKILGNVSQRRKALVKKADIYIVNRENVQWLCDELSSFGQGWGFDMVVIDELSSFKNWQSKRFKALKSYIQGSKRVVGLTGTPSPNGLMDLWAQMYLLDGGERLGKTITNYRERFFRPDKRNGAVIYNYKPLDFSEEKIKNSISDICISMKSTDWLDMPEKIVNDVYVEFSEREQKVYDEFEKEQFIEFMQGEVTALSRAVLINKLLQFSNGAMCTDEQGIVHTSDSKLDRLKEIIDDCNGKPILIFYSYRHDCDRMLKKFKNAVKLINPEQIDKWNKGEIPILLCHPASAGHGLNLQYGGNIMIWYGLTWSLELYQQANARLYRQGQEESVIIHHILTKNTMDDRVLNALTNKADVQDSLIDSLKYKYMGVTND